MKTACAYIRVSTDAQTELSPDSQKKLVIEYCKKNDYIIGENDFFVDLGISASKQLERPQFNQMIAMCKSKEHPYDAIIVWKFSRFARNQEESIVYKSLLRKIGIKVISISEPIAEGLGGKLTEAILEIMDEYYSINLSQEVLRGMKEAASRGRTNGSAPYGYSLIPKTKEDPKDNLRYEVNQAEAEMVKFIFDLFVNQGYYSGAIAYRLNSDGIRTRNGNKWTKESIMYILDNPVYIGKVRYNYRTRKEKHGRGKAKVNPKSEWIIAQAAHEPIIDEDTFNKASEKLQRFRDNAPDQNRLPQKHWLSGVLRCKHCGRGMTYTSNQSQSSKGVKPCFKCQGNNKGLCHARQYTVADEMEKYFFEGLQQQFINAEYIAQEIEPTTNVVYIQLQKQLENNRKRMVRIKQAYMDGIDSIEEYKTNKQLLENERIELESKLSEVTNEQAKTPEDLEKSISNLTVFLESDKYSIQQKNEAVRSIINYITYSKDENMMEFHFR